MPVLRNPRHERFAQGIARGKSQHDAYCYAGYTANKKPSDTRSNAGHLARKPEIADRIAELQEKQAQRTGITVDQLLVELDKMIKLATRARHAGAGTGAIMAKARLLGLITDRVEVDAVVRKPARAPTADKQLSMDEWRQKFAPPTDKDTLQ